MKYSHVVKHNGTFYPAGVDVPVKSRGRKPETEAGKQTGKQKEGDSEGGDDTTPPENGKSSKQEKSGK